MLCRPPSGPRVCDQLTKKIGLQIFVWVETWVAPPTTPTFTSWLGTPSHPSQAMGSSIGSLAVTSPIASTRLIFCLFVLSVYYHDPNTDMSTSVGVSNYVSPIPFNEVVGSVMWIFFIKNWLTRETKGMSFFKYGRFFV